MARAAARAEAVRPVVGGGVAAQGEPVGTGTKEALSRLAGGRVVGGRSPVPIQDKAKEIVGGGILFERVLLTVGVDAKGNPILGGQYPLDPVAARAGQHYAITTSTVCDHAIAQLGALAG